MMRAEEKAGRLPATMTVPMMLFILPALVRRSDWPRYLDITDNLSSGRLSDCRTLARRLAAPRRLS